MRFEIAADFVGFGFHLGLCDLGSVKMTIKRTDFGKFGGETDETGIKNYKNAKSDTKSLQK